MLSRKITNTKMESNGDLGLVSLRKWPLSYDLKDDKRLKSQGKSIHSRRAKGKKRGNEEKERMMLGTKTRPVWCQHGIVWGKV